MSKPSRYHDLRSSSRCDGGRKAKEELFRLHPDHVHVDPGQRLVANVAEYVVVDHEIVDQAFE